MHVRVDDSFVLSFFSCLLLLLSGFVVVVKGGGCGGGGEWGLVVVSNMCIQ